MTTILLADDHEVVRHGLKTLLEKESDFKVVGEAVLEPKLSSSSKNKNPTYWFWTS